MSYNSSSLPRQFNCSKEPVIPPSEGHCTQRSDSDEGFSEEGLPKFFSKGKNKSFSERPNINKNFRSFSPAARQSGEEILQDLKNRLKREKDMFFNAAPDWNINKPFSKAEDSDDWARKNMEDMKPRNPMFGFPSWMSEDEDMTDLASRMSNAPHWATLGRRGASMGPWRERKSSGGSGGMGVTSEDDRSSQCSGSSVPSDPHDIPIRIEAEAPPEIKPEPPQQSPQPPRVGQVRKLPQYATRTTSNVEEGSPGQVPRGTRCASAPPDVTDGQYPQRFVSKINITPQTQEGGLKTSTTNSVPKPYGSHHMQQPTIEEDVVTPANQIPNQTNQNQPQYSSPDQNSGAQKPNSGGQRPSIVRNIPIFIEGSDGPASNERAATPPRQTQFKSESPPQPQRPFSPHFSQPSFPSQFQHSSFPSNFQNFPTNWDMPSSKFRQQHTSPRESPRQAPQQQPTRPQFQQPTRPQQQPTRPQEQQQFTQEVPIKTTEPPKPEPPKDIKMSKINEVKKSVDEYKERANNYKGGKGKKDKEFLYLDEMLTRSLLHLDNIDPDGRDDVRQARKALIKDINETIGLLERRSSVVESQNEQNTNGLENPAEQQNHKSKEDSPSKDIGSEPIPLPDINNEHNSSKANSREPTPPKRSKSKESSPVKSENTNTVNT